LVIVAISFAFAILPDNGNPDLRPIVLPVAVRVLLGAVAAVVVGVVVASGAGVLLDKARHEAEDALDSAALSLPPVVVKRGRRLESHQNNP